MKELRIRREVEKEWDARGDVLSADEVGPLIGLRFKFGEVEHLPREASEQILENETHGREKKFRRKKRTINTETRREN